MDRAAATRRPTGPRWRPGERALGESRVFRSYAPEADGRALLRGARREPEQRHPVGRRGEIAVGERKPDRRPSQGPRPHVSGDWRRRRFPQCFPEGGRRQRLLCPLQLSHSLWIVLVVRGSGAADSLLASMRQAIWSYAPDLTIARIKTLDTQLTDSLATERFQTSLLAAFGASALLLSMLGISGVLSSPWPPESRRSRSSGWRSARVAAASTRSPSRGGSPGRRRSPGRLGGERRGGASDSQPALRRSSGRRAGHRDGQRLLLLSAAAAALPPRAPRRLGRSDGGTALGVDNTASVSWRLLLAAGIAGNPARRIWKQLKTAGRSELTPMDPPRLCLRDR